jgi:hypothetical protein
MSLQQILMQRAAIHFQNKLGNFEQGGAPSQIGDIVANKIEQDRMIKQDMLAKQETEKKIIRNVEEATARGDKITRNIDSEGKQTFKIEPLDERKIQRENRIAEMQDKRLKIAEKQLNLNVQKAEQDVVEEVRRNQAEKRRTTQLRVSNLLDFGDVVDQNDEETVQGLNEFGVDLDIYMQEGKAMRLPNGKIRVFDESMRKRIEGDKTIPEAVQTAITEYKDTKDIFTDAVNEYKSMGLDQTEAGWDLWKQLWNPVGPLSIQKSSTLVRELNEQNPRLAALHSKLERAFQKYRIETTGAQASDKELQRLRPLIANLAQNPQSFMLTAEDIMRELDQSVSNRIGNARAVNRDPQIVDNLEQFYFGNKQSTMESDDPYQKYLKIMGGK